MKPEIDLDTPVHPGAGPDLSLGDLWKYGPVIEALIADVEKALAGGSFTPPPLTFKLAGKHFEIDSVIKVT